MDVKQGTIYSSKNTRSGWVFRDIKNYLKLIFISYIKICNHTWIYLNEMKGFVCIIHKCGIVFAIHMLRDTQGWDCAVAYEIQTKMHIYSLKYAWKCG